MTHGSGVNELHLGACQLNHIAIFQRSGLDAKRRAIERWVASAFDMVNKKTAMPSGDGRDSHPTVALQLHTVRLAQAAWTAWRAA